jgi:hypothetical protein
MKKARTSTALPHGISVQVVVYDAAGETGQSNMLEFPHRVQAIVRTICPPGNVAIFRSFWGVAKKVSNALITLLPKRCNIGVGESTQRRCRYLWSWDPV